MFLSMVIYIATPIPINKIPMPKAVGITVPAVSDGFKRSSFVVECDFLNEKNKNK